MDKDTVVKELKGLKQEMKEAISQRDEEIEKFGKAREKTAKRLDEAGNKIEQIKAEVDEQKDSLEKEIAELKKQKDGVKSNTAKNLGSKFVSSDEYKSAVKNGRRKTNPVNIKGSLLTKDTSYDPIVSGDDSTDALVIEDRMPDMVEDVFGPITMRQLVGAGTTNSDTITYMKETFDNEADFHDNNSLSEVDGDDVLEEKAKSGIKFEENTVNVKDIAHYIPVGRSAYKDAAQIASRINTKGVQGLEQKIDNQVLAGVGDSASFDGILNQGIAEDTTFPDVVSNTLDRIRISIARSRQLGYNVDGIVLDPINFAELQLLKGDDKHYIWVEAGEGMKSTLWRLPVAENPNMSEDKYLIGDFGGSAMLWDRQQATVEMTKSHKDWFTRNMLAILIEARLAFEVTRPAAFRQGSFDSGDTA